MLSVETFDSKSAQAVLNSFCLICIRVCLRDRRSINDSYTVCLRVRGKTRGERCRENGAWRTMQGERCREKDAARHRWRARHSNTARWWRQPWQERGWHRLSLIGSTPRTSAGMLGAHQSCPHFIWELPWDAWCTSNPTPFHLGTSLPRALRKGKRCLTRHLPAARPGQHQSLASSAGGWPARLPPRG